MTSCKEEVLKSLRVMANASTPEEFLTLTRDFESSQLCSDYDCLAKWFKRKWQPHCEVSYKIFNVVRTYSRFLATVHELHGNF